MGKKKTNSTMRVQESFGTLVSKAALTKLGPDINQLVQSVVEEAIGQFARQQATTFDALFKKQAVLESYIKEKLNISSTELVERMYELTDKTENLEQVTTVVAGDVVRLELALKNKVESEYGQPRHFKVYNTGAGEYIDKEVEQALIGMNTGDVKELALSDADTSVRIKIDRVSRKVANDNSTPG